uniref:Uncharacterized protein n=1 Tax=Sphaerodactylus townsendi TaxID=933632 RepID=A0ACB8F0Q5_9SAUR
MGMQETLAHRSSGTRPPSCWASHPPPRFPNKQPHPPVQSPDLQTFTSVPATHLQCFKPHASKEWQQSATATPETNAIRSRARHADLFPTILSIQEWRTRRRVRSRVVMVGLSFGEPGEFQGIGGYWFGGHIPGFYQGGEHRATHALSRSCNTALRQFRQLKSQTHGNGEGLGGIDSAAQSSNPSLSSGAPVLEGFMMVSTNRPLTSLTGGTAVYWKPLHASRRSISRSSLSLSYSSSSSFSQDLLVVSEGSQAYSVKHGGRKQLQAGETNQRTTTEPRPLSRSETQVASLIKTTWKPQFKQGGQQGQPLEKQLCEVGATAAALLLEDEREASEKEGQA